MDTNIAHRLWDISRRNALTWHCRKGVPSFWSTWPASPADWPLQCSCTWRVQGEWRIADTPVWGRSSLLPKSNCRQKSSSRPGTCYTKCHLYAASATHMSEHKHWWTIGWSRPHISPLTTAWCQTFCSRDIPVGSQSLYPHLQESWRSASQQPPWLLLNRSIRCQRKASWCHFLKEGLLCCSWTAPWLTMKMHAPTTHIQQNIQQGGQLCHCQRIP